MNVLTEIKNKLINLQSELPFMLQEVFTELAATVEDFNIAQLQRGQRPDGTFLQDYSRRSVEEFGKPEGPIRLFDEGGYYRGIVLKVFPNGIELIGTDMTPIFRFPIGVLPKSEMLEKLYGQVLGLTDESIDKLMNEYVKPLLEEKIMEYLGVSGLRIAA